MASREPSSASAAAAALTATVASATVEVARLDLADLSSVRAFSQKFLASFDGLDRLINNAGVRAIPYRRTVDGTGSVWPPLSRVRASCRSSPQASAAS